jgi:anti-sigma B factor antagonist
VQADSSVVCRPFGRLDWIGSVHLRDAVCHTLRHGVQVVLDLSMVDFIDSDGLGAVLGSIGLVHCVGGSVSVCKAADDVATYLDVAGVNRLVTGERCSAAEVAMACPQERSTV